MRLVPKDDWKLQGPQVPAPLCEQRQRFSRGDRPPSAMFEYRWWRPPRPRIGVPAAKLSRAASRKAGRSRPPRPRRDSARPPRGISRCSVDGERRGASSAHATTTRRPYNLQREARRTRSSRTRHALARVVHSVETGARTVLFGPCNKLACASCADACPGVRKSTASAHLDREHRRRALDDLRLRGVAAMMPGDAASVLKRQPRNN